MQYVFIAVLSLSASMAVFGEEFPIAGWTFMRAEQQRPVEVVVKEWKDLGFTHPMSPILCENSKEHARIHRMLDLCQENGMKLIVHDERVHWNCAGKVLTDETPYRKYLALAKAEWGSHPACAGFVMLDEPDHNQINVCCKAAQLMKEVMPDKICFLNLLPWYSWIGPRLGSDTYAPYLDRVAKESGLDMLCYDCYDQLAEGKDAAAGFNIYFENLREWREFTQRNPGRRFWVTLMCLSQANRSVRSRTDLRWQISTAAAMGAKGIIWYYVDLSCSQGMNNNDNAPINILGDRTEVFDWLSYENRRFARQFGREFMRLVPEGAFFVGINEARGGINPFAGDVDVLTASSGKEPALVSFFHDEDGGRYLAVVNLSKTESRYESIGLADDVKPKRVDINGIYQPIQVEADPVLARKIGKSSVNRWGDYVGPGQLVLLKLR